MATQGDIVGGIKNPFGGGNIGTSGQIGSLGGLIPGGILGLDTSIKDPAGMQQYTDLANQAQQEYTGNRKFLQENVDPQRKNLLTALADQASGKAPSIAEAQLKSAFDTSLKNQLALARSQRGGNAGLASRNVSNVAAQQQQNLAQQGAIAKLQERNQAQQTLGQQIKNEQDYGVNTLSAALGSQANVATMQNAQRDRNDKRNKDILGGFMDIGKSAFTGGMFAKGGQVQYLAEGGQVKSKKEFYKQLKACGGKVQKKAQGGAVDVGDVSAFAKGAEEALKVDNSIGGITKKKKSEDGSGKDMAGMADLAKVAFMAAEGGQVNDDQVQKVSEMDDEIAKKIFKEKGSIALQKYLQNKKRLPAAEPQQKAEGGKISETEIEKRIAYKDDNKETTYPRDVFWDLDLATEKIGRKFEVADKNNAVEIVKKAKDNMLVADRDNAYKKAMRKGAADGGNEETPINYKKRVGPATAKPMYNSSAKLEKTGDKDPRWAYEDKQDTPEERDWLRKQNALDYGRKELETRDDGIMSKKKNEHPQNMSMKKAEGGLMMKAGGVPGNASHAGDNYANDKVPAMLSPGEVVVPRSVIADGPKAAAHFVEQASKDKNYNAENYAQERPSFIKALQGQKRKDSDYENFKKMIRGR